MRIRQIVFAAQDLAAARACLGELLQLAPPFRDPGVGYFGVDNAVFAFGDQFIEVISPMQPDTACGRHLKRHGDSGYMLIVQTDDFRREAARLAEMGVRSVWSGEHEDISAMHLHPKDIGGAIVSVDEPRPASAWRWGGPDWRVAGGRAGLQRVRGISLRSGDPRSLAARWAQVLGLPAPLPRGQGWRVALEDGFADFLPDPAGREGVAGFTLAVEDIGAVVARARGLGLPVDGSRVSLLGSWLDLEPVPG